MLQNNRLFDPQKQLNTLKATFRFPVGVMQTLTALLNMHLWHVTLFPSTHIEHGVSIEIFNRLYLTKKSNFCLAHGGGLVD